MPTYHGRIDMETDVGRPSYHNLTQQIRESVRASGIREGLCVVSSPHTTCSVFFEEFMHDLDHFGDEYLQVDLDRMLDGIAPRQLHETQYLNPGPEHIAYGMKKTDPDYPAERWTMLNTDGHLRATLIGTSQTLIICNRQPLIGQVGSIYFVDFDQTRRRHRHCNVLVMGEE